MSTGDNFGLSLMGKISVKETVVRIILMFMVFLHSFCAYSQASFNSNTSIGDWNDPASWIIISGVDNDGIPDGDDEVSILSGDEIEHSNSRSIEVDRINLSGTLNVTKDNSNIVTNYMNVQGTAILLGTGVDRGVSVIRDLHINTSSTLNLEITDFSVNGDLIVDGTISLSASTGEIVFVNMIINNGGTWNNSGNASLIIKGNIENNGTWTGCGNTSCIYTLSDPALTIKGTNSIEMPNVIVSSGTECTNENIDNFVVSTSIRGAGTFINGIQGVFTYSGNNSNFSLTSFNASSTGNTVIYGNQATNQRIQSTNTASNDYYNLHIDCGNRSARVTQDITVNNQLTFISGHIELTRGDLIIGENSMISGFSNTSFIKRSGNGDLIKKINTVPITFLAPLGFNDYNPIEVSISNANLGSTPEINFRLIVNAHPDRDTPNMALGGDDDGTPSTSFLNKFWRVTSTDISNVTFDAAYTYTNSDVNGTETSLVPVLYRQPHGFNFQDWRVSGTIDYSTNIITYLQAKEFGDFYAMDNTMTRLPVLLIEFESELTLEGILLNWSTAWEHLNSYFTVEKSTDGRNFHTIGTVKGNLNTNNISTYSFTDDKPMNGINYYRLKQHDSTGDFNLSEVVSVTFEHRDSSTRLSLEKGSSSTIRVLNGKIGQRLFILDISGRTLMTKSFSQNFPQKRFTLPKSTTPRFVKVIGKNTNISLLLSQ